MMNLLKLKVYSRSIYESPIIIAPTAFHRLAHVDGEVATARGATEAQCIYTYNWVYSTMPEENVLQTKGIFRSDSVQYQFR
jgi:isopentenyl diphosphate isomerase/L-lactate dehydrogenase-like FMN-dependent dehydrogenase